MLTGRRSRQYRRRWNQEIGRFQLHHASYHEGQATRSDGTEQEKQCDVLSEEQKKYLSEYGRGKPIKGCQYANYLASVCRQEISNIGEDVQGITSMRTLTNEEEHDA